MYVCQTLKASGLSHLSPLQYHSILALNFAKIDKISNFASNTYKHKTPALQGKRQ
jgi:hypothetical protein